MLNPATKLTLRQGCFSWQLHAYSAQAEQRGVDELPGIGVTALTPSRVGFFPYPVSSCKAWGCSHQGRGGGGGKG